MIKFHTNPELFRRLHLATKSKSKNIMMHIFSSSFVYRPFSLLLRTDAEKQKPFGVNKLYLADRYERKSDPLTLSYFSS